MSAAGVRLRASPASLPGVALASPSDRVSRPGRNLARTTTDPAPSTGGAVSPAPAKSFDLPRTASNEAETPSDREDDHQSRFHGPGASRLSSVAPQLATTLAGGGERALSQPDPLGHLSSRDRGIVGWRAPTLPGADPVGRSAHDDLTTRTPPPRRVGGRGLSTTRLRGAAGRALRC